MWLCLQGLELGLAVAAAAGSTTTTTTSSSSHSARRSHDCCCLSHTSLNPSSSALQTGFAWRWRQRYHQGLATDCQRRDRCLEMCCCVVGGGSGGRASGQSRPQEAIRKAITTGRGFAELSMVEGRVPQTTNMVLRGGTVSEDSPDKWNIIDHQKVKFASKASGEPAARPEKVSPAGRSPIGPALSMESTSSPLLLQEKMLRALKERRTDDAWMQLQTLKGEGIEPSRECLSRLVAQLSHHGTPSSLSKAQRILSDLRKQDKIRQLDSDSLGLLAMASARAGAARYALRIVRLMLELDLYPPVKIWSAIVSRLGRQPDDGLLALELFDDICLYFRAPDAVELSMNTMRPDTGAFNAVLNACATLGLMDRANTILGLMPRFGVVADTLTFNVLIKLYARTEQMELLKGVFGRMEEAGVEPDQSTLNSLVAAYVGLGDLEAAESLVERFWKMPQENVQAHHEKCESSSSHSQTENSIVEYRGISLKSERHRTLKFWSPERQEERARSEDAGSVASERRWGDRLRPDVRTYTTLMKGYVQEGQVGDAMDFLLAMEQKFDPNVSPNEVTYTTAIAACVRLNLMDEAHSILREMRLRKVPANIVTYNILLSGYCRSRNMEKAYALVADMKLAGISLDVVSYNTLINGCIKSGDNVAALAHFQQMREGGIAPSEVSYTTLMKAFGQSGQPRLVHQVFEEMQADPRMRPDSVAWNVLIDSICQSDRMADAKSAFKRMKEARLHPTVVTYTMLVKGFARAGMWGEALVLWNEIKERTEAKIGSGLEPLQPDEVLLDCLVDTCVRAGYFQRALEIVACMEDNRILADKTKYKRMFIELYSDLYTSQHTSQRRRDKSEEKRDAVEAFKFWVGLPNKYYSSDWSP